MKIDELNEEIIELKLENGLRVCVYDNKNLTEFNANYTSYFGSNDLQYKFKDKVVNLPHGIAHFLEHVMFASESGDLFNQFSDLGASANAYTSYNQTSYIFSTAINFKENLKVLMELVQTRYFTEQVVAKEMGIITEEIIMYDQMPEWRLRNHMYEAICQSTNYQYDIAGTVETIKKITPELLNEIFDLFYIPQNQILTLSGNFEGINLEEFLNSIQIIKTVKPFEVKVNKKKEKITRAIKNEYHHQMATNNITRKILTYKMPIAANPRQNIEYYFSIIAFQKSFFSALNPEYNKALEKNVINDNFGIMTSFSPDLANLSFTIVGKEYIESSSEFIRKTMIFEMINKKMLKYGLRRLLASEIRATDNKADFVEAIISCELDNISIKDYYDVLFKLDEKKIETNLKYLFNQMQEFNITMNKE